MNELTGTLIGEYLDEVEAWIKLARKEKKTPYAIRVLIFNRIDQIHEQAEVYLVEAPDYPASRFD